MADLAGRGLDALAACIITPSIAAITLRLFGHAAYGEGWDECALRLAGSRGGRCFARACALLLSERAVFIMTAALVLPALAALHSIRADDEAEGEPHPASLHPRERRRRSDASMADLPHSALHVFAVCAVLFHLANAAMLPLALNELAKRTGRSRAGGIRRHHRAAGDCCGGVALGWGVAQCLGRRPVLLVGFAALPLRGLLFALLVRAGTGGVATGGDPDAGRRLRHGVRPDVAADRRRRDATDWLPQSGDRLARIWRWDRGDVEYNVGRCGGGCVWRALRTDRSGCRWAVAWLVVLLAMPETRPEEHRRARVAAVHA